MESGTKPTRYYLCSDTDTGILSAIYDAGLSCYGHRFIRILPLAPHACYEQTLFSEYVTVEGNAGQGRFGTPLDPEAAFVTDLSVCYVYSGLHLPGSW